MSRGRQIVKDFLHNHANALLDGRRGAPLRYRRQGHVRGPPRSRGALVAARRRPRAIADRPLPGLARGGARARVRRLRRRVALVRRRARRVLAVDLGPLRRAIGDGARAGPCRRADARRAVVPGRRDQLRGARTLDAGAVARRRRDPRAVADPRRPGPHGGRASRRRRALPGRAPAPRRRAWRPGGGVPAQHARGDHRPPGHGLARRRLVVLRAGVRDEGRRRPVRPDRAHGPAGRRRLPVR